MGVRAKFWELLTTDATLTELVGERIYPIQLPQDETDLPAVIVYIEDNDPDMVMSPAYGPDKYFYVIECRSATYAGLDDLASAVDGAIRNKRLAANEGTVIKILERDVIDSGNAGADQPLYVCHLVFQVTEKG